MRAEMSLYPTKHFHAQSSLFFLLNAKKHSVLEAESEDGKTQRWNDRESMDHFLQQGWPQTRILHENESNLSHVKPPNLLQQLLLPYLTNSVKSLIQIKKQIILVSNLFHLRMSTAIIWIIKKITTAERSWSKLCELVKWSVDFKTLNLVLSWIQTQ